MSLRLPPDHLSPETLLVRGGTDRSRFGETSEALFLTSGYVYDSPESAARRFTGEEPGFVYSRYSNPTLAMLAERLRLMEGAETCHLTASGMAAVYAAMLCHVRTGDHVVSARALFGSCHYILSTILPRFGVEVTFVDGTDLAAWRAAFRPTTKLAFCESPANPTLELVDIAAVAEIAHRHGARLVVDNVFATPLYQKPLALGADVVTYSTTKHIDGQGRCLGGAILCDDAFGKAEIEPFLRHTGPALSPFNAWVMLKGLETLPLRVERMTNSAASVADALAAMPGVTRLLYPHHPSFPQRDLALRQMQRGSTLVAFEVAGGRTGAFAFLNALKLIDISNNLGDSKSLITHPPTTTHRAMPEADRLALGITEGFLRLSVGLEAASDLIADLARGADAVVALTRKAAE
ncbi:MAG: O-succinylhomoserine sulfhydrylase [Alphaproteobacteria bacterium]|nr:MAG: O-succinylhomoserine sulfhydrylase [Alphaproteobacteria bacterium]